jgi:hypothetical protein
VTPPELPEVDAERTLAELARWPELLTAAQAARLLQVEVDAIKALADDEDGPIAERGGLLCIDTRALLEQMGVRF